MTTVILTFGTRYLKPFIRRSVKPFVVLDGFSLPAKIVGKKKNARRVRLHRLEDRWYFIRS